jgi:hypothetical protein
VVSHISRKTSEIWGTASFVREQEALVRFLFGSARHRLYQHSFSTGVFTQNLKPLAPRLRKADYNSEVELRSKLQGTRIVSCGDLSEVRVPGVQVKVIELRVVENVEVLKSQFEAWAALFNGNVFEQ